MSEKIEELERRKISHEIEQLRLQTNELSKPWYRKTEFLFLVIPLLFVFGNDLFDNIIDSRITSKTEEIEELGSEIEVLEARESAILEELTNASADADQARVDAESARSEAETLVSDIAGLSKQLEARQSELVESESLLLAAQEDLVNARNEFRRLEDQSVEIKQRLTCDRAKSAFREMTWALYELGKLYNRFNHGAMGAIGVRKEIFDEETERQLEYMALGDDSFNSWMEYSPFIASNEVATFANSIYLTSISERLEENLGSSLRGSEQTLSISLADIVELGRRNIEAQGDDAAIDLFNQIIERSGVLDRSGSKINLAPELPVDYYAELEKLTSNQAQIDTSILSSSVEEFLRFRGAHREAGRVYDDVELTYGSECGSDF